jgi:hypothetical protein
MKKSFIPLIGTIWLFNIAMEYSMELMGFILISYQYPMDIP